MKEWKNIRTAFKASILLLAFTCCATTIKLQRYSCFPEDSQLNETEQYEERKKDFEAKSRVEEDSAFDVLGRNISYTPKIRIRKSSYQGARNEGTEEQTGEYDRSDVFKPFKEAEIKKEAPHCEALFTINKASYFLTILLVSTASPVCICSRYTPCA
jgi:hypothetical protein